MDRQQRLFIIFTTLAGFFAGTVIIAPFINEESPSHVLIYASQAVLLFAALGGFIPTRIRTNKPLIQTKVIKGKQVLWLSILFLLSYPIVSGLTWLSETILAGTAFGQQIIQNDIDQVGQLPAAFPKDSLLGVLLGLASIALLPAFVEEFLFRGVLLKAFPVKERPTYSILMVAFIFSLVHLQPSNFIAIFFMGFVLTYLYWATQSIWVSIAFHAAFNATGYLFLDDVNEEQIKIPIAFGLLLLPGFIYILKRFFPISLKKA